MPNTVVEMCQDLILSDENLQEFMLRFSHEVKCGLARETHHQSSVKCLPTYVQVLPDGSESGQFLAIDLGGTNFRVLLITLNGNDSFQMCSRIYAIPESIMTGSGVMLFDHIAESLANFIADQQISAKHLPLGFTFSFPLKQCSLIEGNLVKWTKGFNCEGVVNKNVVQLLKEAMERRNDLHNVTICAVLNDTTGTLMSCAWKNPNCMMALIVGTGCNICYVERVDEIEMRDNHATDKKSPYMIVNTELGAFGERNNLDFIRTEYDEDIDKHSINPGCQLFEKMVSGMYMGELVRLIMVKLLNKRETKTGFLYNCGVDPSDPVFDVLRARGSFFTKYLSEIESDNPGSYNNCRMVLEELGLNNTTDNDCASVRFICESVSKRSAYLVSAAVATLINKMGKATVTVGVDGSVYRFHPKFHHLMMEKLSTLVKRDIHFDLMLSEDGSGRGAALVAAVADRVNSLPPIQ